MHFHRRASMYVVVIGCTMMITVIGLSALMLVRIERRSMEGTSDFGEAQFYAQSAIEMGLHRIRSDANWRTSHPNGAWETNKPIGGGTYTLEGFDPVDGNLSNSLGDSLYMIGTGNLRGARYKLGVTLLPVISSLSCLGVAAAAGLDLVYTSATVNCDQTMSANRNSSASSSTITSMVEAVGTATGGTYKTTPTTGVPARAMPASSVFDYYVANGTPISYSGIGSLQGKKTIEKKVISPASNPFGFTMNGQGIYVIDCAGQSLRVRNSRIVGTLVILNANSFSVESSVSWEPAVANYPSLLVQGTAQFTYTNTALSESSNSINFNPPSTPYNGAYNSTMLDSYPSLIKGLIYVSSTLSTNGYVTIDGVLVVGQTFTASSGTLVLTYRDTFLKDPPPGFGGPTPAMQVSQGSWKRVVD